MTNQEGTYRVENIGRYFVAYRLSLLGWNVLPATQNAPGIDLLASDADSDRRLNIQIKSLLKRDYVPLGNSLDQIAGDWWIVVTKAISNEPQCFIMKPDEVRRLAHRGENDGRNLFWLHPRQYDVTEFREAWGRIGRGGII
jgi:hypothetical protein